MMNFFFSDENVVNVTTCDFPRKIFEKFTLSRGDRPSCNGGPKAPLQYGPKGLLGPPADHRLAVGARVATIWCDWLQRDGAMAHAAIRVTGWMEGKFGDSVISRFSHRPWPSCTPDTLNPLVLIFK